MMDDFYSQHSRIFRARAREYERQALEAADADEAHRLGCLRQACLAVALRLDTCARLETANF